MNASLHGLISLFLSSVILRAAERAITFEPHGHQMHHCQAFSTDGRFIYFDYRNDDKKLAQSHAIGRVEIASGKEKILYRVGASGDFGPGVGAVTCNPREENLAFIHGFSNASAASPYAPHRRCGMTLSASGDPEHLDGRVLSYPVTSGALRGGTHAFHWSPDGKRISFTYNDTTVPSRAAPDDLRTIGVMELKRPVVTPRQNAEEFSGKAFSAVIVPVKENPRPGSDELKRAFDECWLDNDRVVFQGMLRLPDGKDVIEIFCATLPRRLEASCFPRFGMPQAAPGVTIRRLTRLCDRRYPGVQGPRHWVRASPDGSRLAFLAKDDAGTVQIFQISASDGRIGMISRLPSSVETPFDWSPDGRYLACGAGRRLWKIDALSGDVQALTPVFAVDSSPRFAVCFSPDGRSIAYNRPQVARDGQVWMQLMMCDFE